MAIHAPHGATTGRTMRHARLYDTFVFLLTLGRAGAVRRETASLARLAPGESVLDVGCGTGALTLVAQRRVGATGRVSGIDPSPEMIAVAQRKAARSRREIDYRVAGVESLPFPDASFDVVLSSLMMHHLPNDLKAQGLAEMRRVLKPGGRLLIVDLNPQHRRRGLRLSPLMLVHPHSPVAGGAAPPRLSDLLGHAGFSNLEIGATDFDYLFFARATAP